MGMMMAGQMDHVDHVDHVALLEAACLIPLVHGGPGRQDGPWCTCTVYMYEKLDQKRGTTSRRPESR